MTHGVRSKGLWLCPSSQSLSPEKLSVMRPHRNFEARMSSSPQQVFFLTLLGAKLASRQPTERCHETTYVVNRKAQSDRN